MHRVRRALKKLIMLFWVLVTIAADSVFARTIQLNLTGKTIDTNGQLIPHVGPNAVDGTFNTYYHSAVTNNYKFWRVDLIQEYEVEKIVLHQRQEQVTKQQNNWIYILFGTISTSEKIHPQPDQDPWMTVFHKEDPLGLLQNDILIPKRLRQTRYVVIYSNATDNTSSGNEAVLSIVELQIFVVESEATTKLETITIDILTVAGGTGNTTDDGKETFRPWSHSDTILLILLLLILLVVVYIAVKTLKLCWKKCCNGESETDTEVKDAKTWLQRESYHQRGLSSHKIPRTHSCTSQNQLPISQTLSQTSIGEKTSNRSASRRSIGKKRSQKKSSKMSS